MASCACVDHPSGLFKSVRPGAASASRDDAPHFSVSFPEGEAQLLTVPPLGGVKFTLAPRELPPITEFGVRMDSSLMVGAGGRGTMMWEFAHVMLNSFRELKLDTNVRMLEREGNRQAGPDFLERS